MKKVFKFFMMALAVVSLSLVACTKDEDGEENNQEQQQQQDDSWKQKDSYVATIFTPDNITATDTQTIVPYYYYIEYARTKLTETDTSRIFSVMAFVDSVNYVDEGGVDMVTIYYPYFTHIWSAKKGSGALLGGDICNYRCNLAQSRELVSIYQADPEYTGAQWCADWQNMYMKDIQIEGFDAETGAISYYVSYQMGNLYDYYANGKKLDNIRGATLEVIVSNFTLPKKK